MIKVLAGLTAVVAMCLTASVAAADTSTYDVSGTWTLTNVNGRLTIQPQLKDDTIDVSCHSGDHMTDHKVSDDKLVAGSWKRTDGTGFQVEPKLTKTGQQLTVTVTCKS
jgi:hypothetical protein